MDWVIRNRRLVQTALELVSQGVSAALEPVSNHSWRRGDEAPIAREIARFGS
jgi:hypothetical protein